MAIGVTVGLLALLGVGFGSLALLGADASVSVASDTESIFKESVAFREEYGLKNNVQEATEPPISSSEASRPWNMGDNNGKKDVKHHSFLSYLGVASASYLGGASTNKKFRWGLLFGLIGGAYLAYKVLD